MIKKLGIIWQRFITVALVILTLTILPWTVAAQAAENNQTSTTTTPNKVIHYSSKQVLPDGGIRYVFNVNGVQNILHEPPDGFNPTSATDAQLTEYGFPARPKDEKELTKWQNKWGHFTHKRSSEEPIFTITPIKSSISQQNSANWSGYVNKGSSNQYNEDAANFYQPTWNTSPTNALESSWVGLGGWGSGSLIQAGTMMGWNPYNNNYAPGTYSAWYECLPTEPSCVCVTPFTINGGDDISDIVYWTANSNYPAGFSVFDFNTGSNFDVTVQVPSNCYDRSTAEFIDERPLVGSSYAPLANYGSTNWVGCSENNSQTNFTSLNSYQVTMKNTNNQTLSSPNLASGTNFTDHFYQSQ